ncbi:hypothetical protein HBH70_177840 [Parastagonospora nodorum]|nr:hypothetical protein HBH51_219260 [Parastagonospora nodorum]KAH4600662.1 hypothetical protein HBH82_189000 [Parastagonospora nodorum]KAH4672091.1 hypothetical protein HBH78_177340 [Parastagonospora nodorum]KAH4696901.1 hypothetical protein HBH67_186880 [Parastagonospora nodorum]KAH4764376.1 hypothetical protein HBH63_188060 [Parastagonospora nodorum]
MRAFEKPKPSDSRAIARQEYLLLPVFMSFQNSDVGRSGTTHVILASPMDPRGAPHRHGYDSGLVHKRTLPAEELLCRYPE